MSNLLSGKKDPRPNTAAPPGQSGLPGGHTADTTKSASPSSAEALAVEVSGAPLTPQKDKGKDKDKPSSSNTADNTDKGKNKNKSNDSDLNRPGSAFGNLFSSAQNLFSPQKGADGIPKPKKTFSMLSLPKGTKSKPKGFDTDDYDYIDRDIAISRMQRQGRRLRGIRKVQMKREQIQKEQERAGRYVVWAVMLIQRTSRARQGRHRFAGVKLAVENAIAELRTQMSIKIQSAVRRRLALLRCKKLWVLKGEEHKAAEWKKYQEDSGRRAKIKILAGGTPRPKHDSDDENDEKGSDMVKWGLDPEQVSEMDQKIRRLEQIEKSIQEREKAMSEAAAESEARAKALEEQLKNMEMKQKSEEAERMVQQEMLKQAMGSISQMSARSYNGNGNGVTQPNSARPGKPGPGPIHSARSQISARSHMSSGGPLGSARSIPDTGRHSAPPTARSAREGAGIPPDAVRMEHPEDGSDWVQLWDPDENANYWYCEETQAAQWEEPGQDPYNYNYNYDSEAGYETDATNQTAMTDYSTDYYSGAESEYSAHSDGAVEWQEYWDESAQAKYWYNNDSGEASWISPHGVGTCHVQAIYHQFIIFFL